MLIQSQSCFTYLYLLAKQRPSAVISSQNHIMCYSHEIISDKIIINFEDERVTMNNKNDV